jgi:hypothetical protein
MDDAIVRECATRWDRTTTTTIQKMRAETCERARWGFWEDRRFRTRHREDSARGTRDGRHVGRKSTTFEAIGGADDRVEAEGTTMEVNPFEVDERELEARASEPMGVGLEATPKVKETREDVALGNGDDDSNGTMGASGGGVLENGRHYAGDGMTYGDFFAPPPSYADSVVYTRPETYSRVWGVLRYG